MIPHPSSFAAQSSHSHKKSLNNGAARLIETVDMGAASLAVALISLAWECYTICRSDPITFASLRDDLHSLHSLLQLVKRHHSEDVDICEFLVGCDQVPRIFEKRWMITRALIPSARSYGDN